MTSALPPGGNAHTPFNDPGTMRFNLPADPAGEPVARGVVFPSRPPLFRKIVASLQQVYLALYAAEVGIWEWNVEENSVTWSMFVDKIFGLPPQRTGFSCEEMMRQIPREDLAVAKSVLSEALSAGPAGQRFEFHCRVRRPDGELRWVEITGGVGRSASLCLLGTVRDVTKQYATQSKSPDGASV